MKGKFKCKVQSSKQEVQSAGGFDTHELENWSNLPALPSRAPRVDAHALEHDGGGGFAGTTGERSFPTVARYRPTAATPASTSIARKTSRTDSTRFMVGSTTSTEQGETRKRRRDRASRVPWFFARNR